MARVREQLGRRIEVGERIREPDRAKEDPGFER